MDSATEIIANAGLWLVDKCKELKKKLADAQATIDRLNGEVTREKIAHAATHIKSCQRLEETIKLQDQIRALEKENLVLRHKNEDLVEENLQLNDECAVLANTNFHYEMQLGAALDDLKLLSKPRKD